MVPSNTYRSKNMDSCTPQPPPGGHAAYTSPSTFSLASSFQSSAASHMSAAAHTSSSHLPDTAPSDQPIPLCAAASSSSPKNRLFPPTVAPAPRSSSSAPMGQSSSAVVPSPVASLPPLPLPATASGRLRRAWAGRRKKSEDISTVFNAPPSSDRGYSSDVPPPTSSHSSVFSGDDSEVPAPSYERPPSRTKLFLQSVFKNKNPQLQQQQKSPKFSGSPPVPPPKPSQLQTSKKAPSPPSETSVTPEQASSPIVTSPSISAAIHFINNHDDGKLDKLDVPSSVPSSRTDSKPSAETKQDWRRSDSTMTSYATIRPGALGGNRSPRPVSLAESSHSGHTIVPINKRLSALIADPEFVMAEESDHEEETLPSPLSRHPSPPSSIKARNRRSASLNHGATLGMWAKPTPPESFKPSVSESNIPLPRMSHDYVRMTPTTTRDAPTLTRAAAEGFIAPTTAPGAAHSTSSNIRGRLAAWTAATSSSERPPPPQHPRRPNTANNATFRQTAVSMTGGLAPVAFGFGKRAAEKVHRVWGGLSASTSSHSGYSSSSSLSSSVTPSSYNSGKHTDPMGRSASGQSINSQAAPGGWMRRTPNAPSGSWSVNSSQTTSSSTSDSDAFITPSGPNLGTRLRGPKRNNVGTYIIGGAVFGQNLQLCVRETAIDRVKALLGVPKTSSGMDTSGVKPLEERMLPALVVRCAQHINRWGLQEEGLFRVSGRPSHVAKLRSEFDAGADFALPESDPGDLDPHAVASVFKAYLRELPESLLTMELVPRFEAALAVASDADSVQIHNFTGGSMPAQSNASGLPILRKPPSLSTLAMPSFAGMRTASDESLRTIASLIARLPRENRDLLYTVVELIQATAANCKETKMPLGNLLLVFCPSLNMSPPLLRVLCESKGIWTDPASSDSAGRSEARASPPLPPVPSTPSLIDLSVPPTDRGVILLDDTDYDSDLSDMSAVHRRNGLRRGPVTPHLQVPDFCGNSPYRSSGGSSGQDDAASYVSALDRPFSRTSSPGDSAHHLPALSNSTDSLATPSTMSEVSSLQSPANLFPTDGPREKVDPVTSPVPVIASSADSPLPQTSRRPFISAPIPFPAGTQGGSPQTPASPRKSMALLSFPPLGRSEPSSPQGPSKTWSHRNKRPSLTMLFSKRSASPLSPPTSAARSGCERSPPDTVRAPMYLAPAASQASLHDGPAFLNTPISSSPLFEKAADKIAASSKSSGDADSSRERTNSSASSVFSTPQQTPIADYFRNRSNSSLLSVSDADHRPPPSPKIALHSSPSQSSLTPSIDIGIEDSMGDDWAQSVLLEAQAKSGAGRSHWSVREAIKKFEGLSP